MLTAPTSFSFISLDFQNEYLNLCHSGTDTCAPGTSNGPVVKSFFLIHYVTSGRGIYTVGNKQHQLGAGDAFLIRPGETVVYSADKKDPWGYCFFAFNGSAAEQYINRTAFGSSYVTHIDDDTLYDLVSETTQVLSSSPANTDMYAISQLLKMLLIFADHYQGENERKGRPLRADVQKVIDYLDFHYADPITVLDMAKLVALERSYFYRLFKSEVGISPKEYLTRLRLDKARYLLTETDFPIGQIAESVGFQSFSSFSRLFTAQYCQSPSQYRQTFLTEDSDTLCLGSH